MLIALAAAAAVAAGDWRKTPAANWSQEEALEVLNHSPWAQRVTIQQASGRWLAYFADGTKAVLKESFGGPEREFETAPAQESAELVPAEYGVRWGSSRAVEKAFERLGEVSPFLREQQAPPPELSADYLVLTARVLQPPAESAGERMRWATVLDARTHSPVRDLPPTVPDMFAGLSPDELKAHATLKAGGQSLLPERAVRHGIGTSEGISFYFRRSALPPSASGAEFVFESKKGESFKVRFKFSEMKFAGAQDY
jgi:hypothetical protein